MKKKLRGKERGETGEQRRTESEEVRERKTKHAARQCSKGEEAAKKRNGWKALISSSTPCRLPLVSFEVAPPAPNDANNVYIIAGFARICQIHLTSEAGRRSVFRPLARAMMRSFFSSSTWYCIVWMWLHGVMRTDHFIFAYSVIPPRVAWRSFVVGLSVLISFPRCNPPPARP